MYNIYLIFSIWEHYQFPSFTNILIKYSVRGLRFSFDFLQLLSLIVKSLSFSYIFRYSSYLKKKERNQTESSKITLQKEQIKIYLYKRFSYIDYNIKYIFIAWAKRGLFFRMNHMFKQRLLFFANPFTYITIYIIIVDYTLISINAFSFSLSFCYIFASFFNFPSLKFDFHL